MTQPSRILIVADEARNRDFLQNCLERFGYQPRIVASGEEALAVLCPEVDLLLLDVVVPGISGFELTRRVRAMEPYADLPIIMLTTLGCREERIDAVEAGASDFITKPVDDAELGVRLQVLLNMRRARHALRHSHLELEDKVASRTAALQESEQRYRLLFKSNPQPMWVYDTETRLFLAVNNAAVNHYGYSRDEFLEMSIAGLHPEEDLSCLEASLECADETHLAGVWRHQRQDGSLLWVEVTSHAVEYGDRPARMVIAKDITIQRQAEKALQDSETRFRSVVEGMWEGMLITDLDDHILYLNTRLMELTGFRNDEALGKQAHELLIAPGEWPRMRQRNIERSQGQVERYEISLRRKDGATFWAEVHASPFRDPEGSIIGTLGAITDITERKQSEETIRRQAYHDALTGLPNRALFQDRLEQVLALARRHVGEVAVLFLDLDRFKHINDTLGHSVGDLLLQEVAKRLGMCLRAGDTVARMGGDEFTILLPGLDHPHQAAKVAQKILEDLQRPVQLENREFFVTASLGVSVFPGDGEDAQTLLKHADIAMYRAKEQGRGCYELYTQAMNANAFEQLVLETSLRKALERDELVLYYQPQINLRTGELVGVEALVRWQHPELGLVPPNRFIPLIEEMGLILSVGDWVLRAACRQAAEWQAQGNPMRVAVNLAARQFQERSLPHFVAQVLADAGLEARWLELELTEGTIVKQPEHAIETLSALKDLGIRMSVDDFGTGYSSLSYLRRFPLDVLKIDQSFVRHVTDDPKDHAVVGALIGLAHALDLSVIAEGVETQGQRDCLAALDCDAIQGYLISRPLTASSLTEIARASISGELSLDILRRAA